MKLHNSLKEEDIKTTSRILFPEATRIFLKITCSLLRYPKLLKAIITDEFRTALLKS